MALRPWALRTIDETQSLSLARELRVLPTTARCLVGRGLQTADVAAAYLEPRLASLRAPDGMAGFGEAVARLVAALAAGETIGVFGDYDVDGVSSAALLTGF